jgi:hypothetical protein
LTTSSGAIATYAASTRILSGVGAGTVSLKMSGNSASLSLSNAIFTVSNTQAKIAGLYTFAYTGSPSVSGPGPFSETQSSAVRVTFAQLSLKGQTTFSGSTPSTNFAKLVTFAQGDDGYFTDVSQYSGLSITSVSPTNINASSRPPSFHPPPFFAVDSMAYDHHQP